jgi:hypothetical protein
LGLKSECQKGGKKAGQRGQRSECSFNLKVTNEADILSHIVISIRIKKLNYLIDEKSGEPVSFQAWPESVNYWEKDGRLIQVFMFINRGGHHVPEKYDCNTLKKNRSLAF